MIMSDNKKPTFDELLEFFDFSYKQYPDGYGLIDEQEANLGNIEDERFSHPSDLINRIVNGIYWDDYLEGSMNEEELDKFACEDFAEFWTKCGDNVNFYPDSNIYYYLQHPEETEGYPEILDEKKIYHIYMSAREQAEKYIEEKAKSNGYPYVHYYGDKVETQQELHCVAFQTEEDLDKWLSGDTKTLFQMGDMSNIDRIFKQHYSVCVNDFFKEEDKIKDEYDLSR